MSVSANETDSLWTEKEKQIFQYHNGREVVWGDPLAIRHRLYGEIPNLSEILKITRTGDTGEKADALLKLEKAIRVAFIMTCNPKAKTPEEYGATHSECIAALKAWLNFCKKKDESTATSPTV